MASEFVQPLLLHKNNADVVGSCERLRSLLETGSVLSRNASANGLNMAVLHRDRQVMEILGRGFHHVIIVDAASGLERGRGFNPDLFLAELCRVVGPRFGLQLDPARFHAEDIFQILKDEPMSLLCLVHFECIDADSRCMARAFTQGNHRVLILHGPVDLPLEFGKPDSKTVDAVRDFSPGAPRNLPPFPFD